MRTIPISTLMLCVMLSSASATTAKSAACDVSREACVALTDHAIVSLDISPKPVRAMKELFFSVTVKGARIRGPLLLMLFMPGMYMGRNEVELKQAPDGSFTGRGIIPRCPTGKNLWQADIAIPDHGSVSYRFYVNY